MTTPHDGKAFLQVCLAKRLFDKAHAKEIWSESQRTGVSPQQILIQRGLMASHTVQALEKELRRALEPRSINGFQLIKPLGQGGMATVFLAKQVSLDRDVALKLMAPAIAANPEMSERFLREARVAATLNHPNIISIIDVGRSDGQLYMALELVTGGDAAQLAQRFGGALPEARALELLIDCAKGLQALFEARLVHRDLKPANIFITNDGTAKLGDLGLARSEDGVDRLTVTGHLVGTPAFMSPEQASGEGTIDIRSDIYALGATLFALVTGRQPFVANNPIAVAAKALIEAPPDPRTLAPDLTAMTAALILRAMSKSAAERFQTPRELREALEQALKQAPQQAGASRGADMVTSNQPATPVTLVGGHHTTPHARPHPVRRQSAHPGMHATIVTITCAMTAAIALLIFYSSRASDGPIASSPSGSPTRTADSHPSSAGDVKKSSATASQPALPPSNASTQADRAIPPSTPLAHPPAGQDPPAVAWAAAQGRDAFGHWLTIAINDVQQRLRWMPPGTCVVGSPPNEAGRNPDNETQSLVTFTRGVWLADTECTQAFWFAVTGRNPAGKPHHPSHPVNQITVVEAITFARSLRPRLGNALVRLPSRAEWERACRAGATSAYATGDDVRSLLGFANVFDLDREATLRQGDPVPISDGVVGLAPVARFKPNAWGFYDMHGNVAEYCLAKWFALPPMCRDPETDDDPAHQRGFIRGGAFDADGATIYRVANHAYIGEGSANPNVGLRLLIESP